MNRIYPLSKMVWYTPYQKWSRYFFHTVTQFSCQRKKEENRQNGILQNHSSKEMFVIFSILRFLKHEAVILFS